jgi:hypothetical protein
MVNPSKVQELDILAQQEQGFDHDGQGRCRNDSQNMLQQE